MHVHDQRLLTGPYCHTPCPVLLQLLSVCREDGARLSKLRHPQILRLLEPFEETRRQGQQCSAWSLGDGGWWYLKCSPSGASILGLSLRLSKNLPCHSPPRIP